LQKTLSKTLLVIIIIALHYIQYKNHSLQKNLGGDDYTTSEIFKYKTIVWNKNKKNISKIERDPSNYFNTETLMNLHTMLFDSGLFTFYNNLIEIENYNYRTNYLNRMKTLSNQVNKYFFLTEVLFKLLTDTNYNITENGDNKIVNKFSSSDIDEIGIKYPNNNYKPALLNRWRVKRLIRKNNCRSGYNPSNIMSNMKYKLLKNIYNIILKINKDKTKIEKISNKLTSGDGIISNSERIITEMKNDKNIDSRKITTLLKKQKEIKTTNKILFIKTLLLFIILILIISSNIYISTTSNPNKLLQLNFIIIVIIFIIKFYYLFK